MVAHLHAPPPGPTIIQVDDSVRHSTHATKALRALVPGINVVTFNSGRAAIEHLSACGTRWHMPELVLLDWRPFGGIDGFEVLQAIRTQEHLAGIAVLVTSGSNEEEHICRAADLGAGYIIKPVESDDYPAYAQQVEQYRRAAAEKLLVRSLCSLGGAFELPTGAALAQSGPAIQAAPFNSAPTVGSSVQMFLAGALEYFGGGSPVTGTGLYSDRKLVELTCACREVGIDEIDILTPSKDAVIVIKRRKVIFRLMDAEWSNPEIKRRVPVRDRYLDEARGEWNRLQRGKRAALVQSQTPKALE